MRTILGRLALLVAVVSGLSLPSASFAQSVTLRGTVAGAGGYTAALVYPDGSSQTRLLPASGAFSFTKVNLKRLRNASLQLVGPDGRFFGPVVLGRRKSRVSISFSGKNSTQKAKTLALGRLSLRSGFAIASPKLSSKIYSAPKVAADSTGKPAGAGNLGIVATSSSSLRGGVSAAMTTKNAINDPGADPDGDGIVNSFDADDNGNSVLDSADPASSGSDTPYVSLNFDLRRTLNANVRDGLSPSAIDAVVASENAFASTFFISLPQNSAIDGGYLVCGDALTYCRPNNPLGFSSGVSESSDDFRGPMSSLVNAAGYPVLERIFLGSSPAIVLSMQPRVGRDVFRPGDLYRVVLTSGTQEVSSRTFTLPPYFVSVPAIKEYTANGATVAIDYTAVSPTSGSIPGTSPGDPIILGSDGVLGLSFWRPQREPIGAEVGYQDFGALNYGVIIENAQATCAGFYSAVSGDLVEDSSALGQGNSPFANQGANMNPLVDQTTDRATSSSNLLSFNVDLKSCLARSGGTPGTYGVTLSAAGADLTGGRNTANQFVYVTIP